MRHLASCNKLGELINSCQSVQAREWRMTWMPEYDDFADVAAAMGFYLKNPSCTVLSAKKGA